MKYDLTVFIGRFQPLHLGHQAVIERALSFSKKVLILVGSANASRSPRNPLTVGERIELISSMYPTDKLILAPLDDYTYNDTAWAVNVRKQVKLAVDTFYNSNNFHPVGMEDLNIAITGAPKDDGSSYFVDYFPEWTYDPIELNNPIHATSIRNQLFIENVPLYTMSVLDTRVIKWLTQFKSTEAFERIAYDAKYERDYPLKYGAGPHMTGDALVQVGTKILLIKRGREYGYGLFALPGGFVNPGETFDAAIMRELKEETKIKVPLPVLKGSVVKTDVFDNPNRSGRARIVTKCAHILLANDVTPPEVRGSDDADEALWIDISDIDPTLMFEDHFHIIRKMLNG